MADQKHDVLETWQLAVGLATAVIGLLYYARKPAAAKEPATVAPGPPAGYGEVAGSGAGGGVGSGIQPPPLIGQQNPPSTAPRGAGTEAAGGAEASKGNLPKTTGIPAGEPLPGESQAEWERNHWAKPLGQQGQMRHAA